jgi:hypothetical protein
MSTATRLSYTYAVLRYMHDVVTGEFINVGVVAVTTKPFRVAAKFRTTFGRVKDTFPNLDTEVFRARMRALQHRFDEMAKGDMSAPSRTPQDIAEALKAVLPTDDSALQWSSPGSGLTSDLNSALLGRYNRMVIAHDSSNAGVRRKDDDVWKHFRTELEVRNVLGRLKPKDIRVADDAVHFEHAWKNGHWNCLEPLSFDLASAESIKEKAHKWLGQLQSVSGALDGFEVFFLVGRPSAVELHSAYTQAMSILRKSPAASVVEEDQAVPFSEQLAAEIIAHDQQQPLKP